MAANASVTPARPFASRRWSPAVGELLMFAQGDSSQLSSTVVQSFKQKLQAICALVFVQLAGVCRKYTMKIDLNA